MWNGFPTRAWLAALALAAAFTPADLEGMLQSVGTGASGDWDVALRAWARDRLAAGEADLHAHARERFDRALLEAALEHTGGRRTEAATRLGLGRNTVTRKLGASRKRR